MFLARRPSAGVIDGFLRESQDLPLSYGPVGIVGTGADGWTFDEETGVIGHGQPAFERARAALLTWTQFDLGWVETFPRDAQVGAGTVVAVLIRHLGFWSLNGARVVYEVGSRTESPRFGFAYGTLTNHAEAGEELFEVFIDPLTEDVAVPPSGRVATASRAGAARQADRPRAPGSLPAGFPCRDDTGDGRTTLTPAPHRSPSRWCPRQAPRRASGR